VDLVADAGDAAEVPERRPSSLTGLQAGPSPLFGFHLDVKVDLALHVLVELPSAEQGA